MTPLFGIVTYGINSNLILMFAPSAYECVAVGVWKVDESVGAVVALSTSTFAS
jgi:hypothetical protein